MENTITLRADNTGEFFGPIASKYSYTPALRARLDEVFASAMRSDNSYFVLESDIVRAAQTTKTGALRYMSDARVLVQIGCGEHTHVAGTNGGTMPCGSYLTTFGKRARYFCPQCD